MKTSVPESIILIKLQADGCNFIKKETLAQVFSCGDMTFIIENCIYAVSHSKK